MRYVTILAALAVTTTHATGIPEPVKPSPPPTVTQDVAQEQTQAQGQRQSQDQRQQASSVATSSAYGEGFATANNQMVNNTPKQAPALSQGSFAIQGCAVAGNAGGSGAGGAGFLGFGFTPEQCYDFMLAQAYASVGAHVAACEVLNASRAGQRAAKRGVKLPECSPPVPVSPPPPVVVNVAAASAASDCKAATDAAFKQCVAK